MARAAHAGRRPLLQMLLILAAMSSALVSASLANQFDEDYQTSTLSALLPRQKKDPKPAKDAESKSGQGIVSFLTSVGVAVAIFAVQVFVFSLIRNKLARIL